jgi:hypothetical protein
VIGNGPAGYFGRLVFHVVESDQILGPLSSHFESASSQTESSVFRQPAVIGFVQR